MGTLLTFLVVKNIQHMLILEVMYIPGDMAKMDNLVTQLRRALKLQSKSKWIRKFPELCVEEDIQVLLLLMEIFT